MKAKNLKILQNNNIKIPKFITVKDENNLDLSFSKSKLFQYVLHVFLKMIKTNLLQVNLKHY